MERSFSTGMPSHYTTLCKCPWFVQPNSTAEPVHLSGSRRYSSPGVKSSTSTNPPTPLGRSKAEPMGESRKGMMSGS